MLAMTRARAEVDGTPNELMARYRSGAEGYTGLSRLRSRDLERTVVKRDAVEMQNPGLKKQAKLRSSFS